MADDPSREPRREPDEAGLDGRRERDHATIATLADDLLPALVAKLAATGLGEIEVREGGWRARLRNPVAAPDGRNAGRAAATGGHGHAGAGHSGQTTHPHSARPADPPRRSAEDDRPEPAAERHRVTATSPAVGIYHPRRELTVGMRVRAGDRLGTVDVLGIRQDVLSPVDGVVGPSLAESGEAVEYGQDLLRLELAEHDPAVERTDDRPRPSVAGLPGASLVDVPAVPEPEPLDRAGVGP